MQAEYQRLTGRNVQNIDIRYVLVAQADLLLHIDLEWSVCSKAAECFRRARHHSKLLMRAAEGAKIPYALLQLRMCGIYLDRDKLFGSLAGD
jgi:hypothetical protein